MTLKAITLTPERYKEWDEFCLQSGDAWFWHTTGWLRYTLAYKPELATRDLSVLICDGNDRIKAIVPLTLETKSLGGRGIREFSSGEEPIPGPAYANSLSAPDKELVEKFVFFKVDELARQHDVKRASFRQTPLTANFLNHNYYFNYFLKYGYLDISLNTQLIDLRPSEEELWRALRRNHRRNIKKVENLTAKIYTSAEITPAIFEKYQIMHRIAAGRQTRPDETFRIMFEWIKEHLGFLAAIEVKGKTIGFEYFTAYKNNGYGFSAANDPEFAFLPIRHLVEWQAILRMKRMGYDFYEIGVQWYAPLLHDFPDEKRRNIAHFKRGFGGFAAPCFRAEKFYGKDYFLEVYQDRVKKFANAL